MLIGSLGETGGVSYLLTSPASLFLASSTSECFPSAKFGQMRAFLKLQIICDNRKLGEMHDNREKVQNFT